MKINFNKEIKLGGGEYKCKKCGVTVFGSALHDCLFDGDLRQGKSEKYLKEQKEMNDDTSVCRHCSLKAENKQILEALIELLKENINQFVVKANRKTWQQYYSDEIKIIEKATGTEIEKALKKQEKVNE